MSSFAELASKTPDEDVDIIRELLTYDALCPLSCQIVRGECQELRINVAPSPFHWSRQVEWPWCLRHAELQPHHFCLDIGSGWSVLKYAIAKRCARVFAVDNNREFLEKTQHSINKLGFSDKIVQSYADARDLPFPDNFFDRVFCVSVLEHVEGGHRTVAREAVRVLKPGGRLLLTMDAIIRGEAGQKDNFHMTAKQAAELIMEEFGIYEANIGKAIGARVRCGPESEENVDVVVLMVCYHKPGVM